MRATSRITAKGKTTIPLVIRKALKAKPGDTLLWTIGTSEEAIVKRVQTVNFNYLQALESTLTEWNSAADEKAYRDL